MPPVFSVQAQFLELYNEQIRDLFDSARRGDGKGLHIHEDAYGSIYLKGATMKSMSSEEEVCLCMHAYVHTYVHTYNTVSPRSIEILLGQCLYFEGIVYVQMIPYLQTTYYSNNKIGRFFARSSLMCSVSDCG